MLIHEKHFNKENNQVIGKGPFAIELPFQQTLGNLNIEITDNRVNISDIDLVRGDSAVVLNAKQTHPQEKIQTLRRQLKDIFEYPHAETITLRSQESVRISTQTINEQLDLEIFNFGSK